MIYSQLEVEAISKDKKEALSEILRNISKRTNGKDEDNINNSIGLGVEIL